MKENGGLTHGAESFSQPRPEPVVTVSTVNGTLTLQANPTLWWPQQPWPGNYGDLIGPWLFEKMTGRTPLRGPRGGEGVIHSVGSIAAMAGPGCIVWGSGNMKHRDPPNPKADYRAVRGPLTRESILRAGGACPRIYGDPSLLLPRFIPKIQPSRQVGIAAHYVDEARIRALYDGVEGVRVISMLTDDVREKTLEILSCQHLLTSSLHGLVAAHAFEIPVRWIIWSDSVIGGGWKFLDYLEGVGLEHEPLNWKTHAPAWTAEELAAVTVRQQPRFDAGALLGACPWNR